MDCFSEVRISFQVNEINPQEQCFTFPASEILEKTADQIIQLCLNHFKISNTKNHFLFICSEKIASGRTVFKFRVPNNLKPKYFFNLLSFYPLPNKPFTDVFLFITRDCCPSQFNIPLYNANTKQFLCQFPIYKEYPFSLTDISNCISTAFPNLNSKTDIYFSHIDGFGIETNSPFKDFQLVQNMLKLRICAAITCDKKTESAIFNRTSIIKEILGRIKITAAFYSKFAETRKFFEQCSGIEPHVFEEIFKQAECLTKFHQQLLVEFGKYKRVDYLAEYGRIFSSFLSYFDLYKPIAFCIEKYHIISILKQHQLKFSQISEFMDLTNNVPIDQYINSVYKTLIDFQELIKKLFSYTPQGHPDYENCKKAFRGIQQIVTGVNASIMLDENQNFFASIQKQYGPRVPEIQITGTQYIESYIVCTKKMVIQANNEMMTIADALQKRLLILLSNCIIFAKENKGQFDFQYSFALDRHGFYPYKDRGVFYSYYENTITYETLNQDVFFNTALIEFETTNKRNEFLNLYRSKVADLHPKNRIKQLFSNATDRFRSGGSIKIEKAQIKNNTISISHHSLVCYHNRFYSFGGLLDGKPTNRLMINCDTTFTRGKLISISERYNALMVNHNNVLYIYGGTTDGETQLNDLYQVELIRPAPVVRKLGDNSHFSPIPSHGYTLTHMPSHNVLILIGGSTEFNCYLFYLNKELWRPKKYRNQVMFRSLVGHQAVAINHNDIAIIGGKTTDENGNVSYNNAVIIYHPFAKNVNFTVFRTTGFYPFNRFNHHAIPLNKYLIMVFGGEFEKMTTSSDSAKYQQFFEKLSTVNEKSAIYLLNLITGEWSLLNTQDNEDLQLLSLQGGGVTYSLPDQPYGTSTVYFYNGIKKNHDYLTDFFKLTVEMNDSETASIPHHFSLYKDDFYYSLLTTDSFTEDPFPEKPKLQNPYQRADD